MSGSVVFQGVSKRYGSALAVNDVSFAIEPGTLVTFLGPSGCGKTTTLRLIAGLEQASAGRILIDSQDVTLKSPLDRDVSMVFQSYALFPHLSVMENVCYGLRASGLALSKAAAQAHEALEQVGLTGFERRLPSELSGGQQQRVALARAMVLKPSVLLFDEPLSNLDARLRRRVRGEIRALQQSLGLTVVYVTHDQSEALAISDRIVVMHNGRIAQDGAPRALYETPADRFVVNFLGEASVLPARIETVEGDIARIRCAGAALVLPRRGLGVGPAALAVRPHAVRLYAEPRDLPRGRIAFAVYGGDHMEYDVRLDDSAETLFVIDAHVERSLAAGTAVWIEFLGHGIALLPDDRT